MKQAAGSKPSDTNKPSQQWHMLEFFAGSGLVAYGLKGMFEPVWANDINPKKAAVYQANLKHECFCLADVKNIHGNELPQAHLSWASFPCQDLSLAGSTKGINASRSGLVWQWLRVLDEMSVRPKILALENVVGLLSANHGDNYRALHKALVERGYKCGAFVLNASSFVPQSRPRVFVLAIPKKSSIPHDLIDSEPCWLHNAKATMLGKELDDWIWWNTPKPNINVPSLEQLIDESEVFNKDEVLSLIPQHHQERLRQYETLYATGYRRTRNGRQQLELRFDGIAGCLRTPEGGSSKQYLIVKKDAQLHARLLTAREAARLMGAPDDFALPGTQNDGYLAMGDAVAVPVAKFIGQRFLMPLAKALYQGKD